MSLRDLVAGSDVCTPSDGGGPSNAVGTLTNALLGTSKIQDKIQELPFIPERGPELGIIPENQSVAHAARAAVQGDAPAIPGLTHLAPQDGSWLSGNLGSAAGVSTLFQEYDAVFNRQNVGPPIQPGDDRAFIIEESFKTFMRCAESGLPYNPAPLPPIQVPLDDQCRIRDRAVVMARQLYFEMGPEFADSQAQQLLLSMGIDPIQLPMGPNLSYPRWDPLWMPETQGDAHLDSIWNNNQSMRPEDRTSHSWASDFASSHRPVDWSKEFAVMDLNAPDTWANEYKTSAAGLVPEFLEETSQTRASADQQDAQQVNERDTTGALIEKMSNDPDPKIRNSKFLQFVSKMSRGELLVNGNEVMEVNPVAESWAGEFSDKCHAPPGEQWVEDFNATTADSKLEDSSENQWAREFGSLEGGWLEDNELEDWASSFANKIDTNRLQQDYKFSDANPFLQDSENLLKGRQFFGKGVLTEAALAVEAELQQNPDNAEAWRLLGAVHAENDDDIQAIAAFRRARELDPSYLGVLLSMAVSYANELEEGRVVEAMMEWLSNHTLHKEAARTTPPAPDSSQELAHAIGMFQRAVEAHPNDYELVSSLGVLQHLARDFEAATASFRHALEGKIDDYSLWNKLGATLANSGKSSEALESYQKALDIKPNYMRGWANLGISYANLGDYLQSLQYYIRALSLNSNAGTVWGYLRTSLLCAGHVDLMPLVDAQDLPALKSKLGLE